MRALCVPGMDLVRGSCITVEGDAHHHLANVTRVSIGEEVLLLDTRGTSALSIVTELSKRSSLLQVGEVHRHPAPAACDVLLVVPKREALDLMLKMAVELGVRRVLMLRGDYSPERLPDPGRVEALLRSAGEQSNNPWWPDVRRLEGWGDVPWDEYRFKWCLDVEGSRDLPRAHKSDGILTVVGPEGGFSPHERAMMDGVPGLARVSLPTPVLRAPTAMAAGWGWMMARAEA